MHGLAGQENVHAVGVGREPVVVVLASKIEALGAILIAVRPGLHAVDAQGKSVYGGANFLGKDCEERRESPGWHGLVLDPGSHGGLDDRQRRVSLYSVVERIRSQELCQEKLVPRQGRPCILLLYGGCGRVGGLTVEDDKQLTSQEV